MKAASRTPVRYEQDVLSASDIVAVLQLGKEMEDERVWRNEGKSSSVIYLQHGNAFDERLPKISRKLRALGEAAAGELYDKPQHGLSTRVVELHRSTVGGGLPELDHYDLGSIITVDVRLSQAGSYCGGEFRTVEADNSVRGHGANFASPGDALAFVSHKRHHVSEVTLGERQVLVVEYWKGEPRTCAHRCTQRSGPCEDIFIRDEDAKAAVAADCFFSMLGTDALAALDALDAPESGEE